MKGHELNKLHQITGDLIESLEKYKAQLWLFRTKRAKQMIESMDHLVDSLKQKQELIKKDYNEYGKFN